MLKTWITGCLICCACVTNGSAQNSRAIRIYGEVTTVMNRKICGYITWGKNLYWTDIFTAGKIGNPYMRYRDIMGDNVRFSDGRRDTPPEHEFSCRFGNIRSIRVIGDRRIELGVKGGNVTELERGRSLAIGNWIAVELRNGKTESVVWDHISEIVFSAAPGHDPRAERSSHCGYRGDTLRDVQGACPMGSGREFTRCVTRRADGIQRGFRGIQEYSEYQVAGKLFLDNPS